MLELMYITNDPVIAQIADDAGVDRVWIDLESKDKEKRQKGLDTVKSHHTIADIVVIKPLLKHAKMQVRVDHMGDYSDHQIGAVLDAGTDYIMLPYYKTVDEVRDFVRLVNHRATTILLLETKEAMELLDETLAIPGVDEIHIGLNDLHLSLGMDFMFEPVANGMAEEMCAKIRAAEKPYGFGGVAKLHEGAVPAELVIGEHYRLGSSRAILSRSFCNPQSGEDPEEISKNFHKDLAELRQYETSIKSAEYNFFETNQLRFQNSVRQVVESIRKRKESQ